MSHDAARLKGRQGGCVCAGFLAFFQEGYVVTDGLNDTKRDDTVQAGFGSAAQLVALTNPLFRKCLDDHAAKDARIERLEEALRSIVKHQEIAGGNLSELSATRRIALDALEGRSPGRSVTPS